MKSLITKKYGAAVLVFLLSVGSLAGCGNQQQAASEKDNGEKPTDELEETYLPASESDPAAKPFTYVEKLEIEDLNNPKATYEIYMPTGSEVNDGFGFYNQHGVYFTATVNTIEGYEDFEDYLALTLEYWMDPDTDYTDIYSSGILENGIDRYYILTGRGTSYDGMPLTVRRMEYMEVQPSGDCVNWNLDIIPENVDDGTDLLLADIEESHNISLELLKKDHPLPKEEHNQDKYTVKEGKKALDALEEYQYLGCTDLSDYSGKGVCPVMIPRGYYNHVKDSHACCFLHGVFVRADVEEFYNYSTIMANLKSSLDLKYESRSGNTDRIRNVFKSAMDPVPGFENALSAVISYDKLGCDAKEYFPDAEILCYIQYDKEHYLALEIFLSGEKYDDATNTVIRELESAYGINLSDYYTKGSAQETPNDPAVDSEKAVTMAKLIGEETDMTKPKSDPLPDTVLWFNATYAPLTYSNGWNWKLVGGLEPTEDNIETDRYLLMQSWSIYDQKTALEKADWLIEEGHRKTCRTYMEELRRMGLLDLEEKEFRKALLQSEISDSDHLYRYRIAYKMYQDGLDADAMAAWDLCRANQLYAAFYICGYMTYEEAMDASLENSRILQKLYSSWDEMMEGYLLGYQFWQDDPDVREDSPTKERRRMYEMMLQTPDNPYKLDWGMELIKSW